MCSDEVAIVLCRYGTIRFLQNPQFVDGLDDKTETAAIHDHGCGCVVLCNRNLSEDEIFCV
jgi:hypothetical protein